MNDATFPEAVLSNGTHCAADRIKPFEEGEIPRKSYTLRKATKDDCPAILEMIKELATFEEMSEHVKMTSDRLIKDGFSSDPPFFRCLVAESVNGIVGYAMYFFSYSPWVGRTMHLEDIYVNPKGRNQGIGTALLREVAKLGVDNECNIMEWIVLSWNKLAISLYNTIGATDITSSEHWHLYRLEGQKMRQLSGVHPLKALTELERGEI